MNRDVEIIETLNELREHIATISGSALLAGDKHGKDDKRILYSEACSALCSVEYAISLFTRPASEGAVTDAMVERALLAFNSYSPGIGGVGRCHTREHMRATLTAALTSQQAGDKT